MLIFQSEHPHPGAPFPGYTIELYQRDVEIIRLLKIAFTQRLIFKVDNNKKVEWNVVHHM